jgi:uncharacterized membrane protein YphA (DoxX/SURF4 family)
MVLLRIAIGWHLCYEGYNKLQSHWTGVKPFSSEMYLRNSTGPFREHFREIIHDFHGLDRLDPSALAAAWQQTLDDYAAHYNFNEEQRTQAQETLDQLKDRLNEYYGEGGSLAVKIQHYRESVQEWEAEEGQKLPPAAWGAHQARQSKLYKDQLELTAPAANLTKELENTLQGLRTEDQTKIAEPSQPFQEWPKLKQADTITMWGLFVFGALMMLGLFSRLSCLGAACLLALFYFSNPPWPGFPPPAVTEGTYLYVNKNLIEMIACLMLATSPSGIWGGLDALVRGMITRPLFGVGAQEIREQHGEANL